MARSPTHGRFSASEGRWYGRQIDGAPLPDPYAPDSPDYAQRNRKVEMMLPGGVLRVDYGSPAGTN